MKRPGPLLSLLLLLASPAAGGMVLPAFHPCPVDAPWMAENSGHAGHHESDPPPATDPTSHHCTCISSCSTGPALAGFDGAGPAVDWFQTAAPLPAGSDASLFLAPIAERLPPANPPPAVQLST